jgi:hypothetical protein
MNSRLLIAAMCVVLAAGCGGGEAPPAESTEPAASAAPAATGPRVFFITPTEGAMVKSPVKLEFGIEDFTIAAVPEGTVTDTRPTTGHHHVGVEQECLPPGTEIPRGMPSWVHFGMGTNTIDMQLEPGPHTLSLQVGDDLHRTIEGLCQTIHFTVVP